MRFRRCATPQYCASKQRHAKEKSSPARSSPASGHEPGYGLGTTSSGKEIRTISSSTILKSSYFGVPLEKAPGTFSQHIQRGRMLTPSRPRALSANRISRTIRICSIKRPERAPARPALAPATDRSWHGLPPQMMSTGGSSAPCSFVMSPTWSISGKRSFVTSMGKARSPTPTPA